MGAVIGAAGGGKLHPEVVLKANAGSHSWIFPPIPRTNVVGMLDEPFNFTAQIVPTDDLKICQVFALPVVVDLHKRESDVGLAANVSVEISVGVVFTASNFTDVAPL